MCGCSAAAAANPKHSITCVAWGSADGQVLAPNYINAGTMLTANALGGVRFFPNSAIILKPKTHMMDGSVFPKLLVSMAKQVPGGVSIRNRVLLILDGHASRFSADTKGTAAALGFDLLILPGQCTHFLQPWDQLFSSVKASHGKLVSGAAQFAGSGGFRPTLPQRISMIDSALHFSVGFSREPLKRAFAKTGLYPPNKEQLLAAAKASIQGGKGMATLAPWKRLTVTNDMMDAAVRRSAEEQPPLYFRAVDQFYNRQELEEQVSIRAAKSVSFPAQPLAPPPGSGAPAAAATNSTQLFHQQEWQQHCLTSLPPALQPADGNLAAAMASTAICPLPLLAPSRPPSHPSSPSHPYLASSSRADSPEQQGLADDSWSGAVGSWSPGGLPSRRAARSLAHLPSVKALASAIAKGCRDDEGVVGPEEVAALQRARLFVMQQFFSRLFSQQRTRRAGMFFRLPIFLVAARLSVHLLFSGLFGLWTQTAEGVDALEQMDAAMVQLFDPHGYMQRNLSILQSSPAAVSIMTHHPHKVKSHENERSHFSDVSPTLRAALPEPASAEARRLLLAGQHAEAARALAGRQRSRGQAAAQAVPQGNGEASCTPATCSVLKTRLNKAQQALLYNEAVTATAAGRDKSQDVGGHPTGPEH
ncbi:hypothetical protein QJQ45_009564 [Haematococcus lacustris]|nr:hypothetical protein QJQ45_009564 [Haematococcus lacustris]